MIIKEVEEAAGILLAIAKKGYPKRGGHFLLLTGRMIPFN
jgi:hypothetical protein